MAVQSDNQQPVPSRPDKTKIASEAELASLNLCGNALAFVQAVHCAYTVDVVIDSHSWDRPVWHGDARAQAKATHQHRDDSVIWG